MLTSWPPVSITARCLPVSTSQSTTRLGLLLASILPSGEKANDHARRPSWVKVASSFPVAVSQRRMAPTQSPEASILPSAEKAVVLTASVCPLQTKRTLPVGRSWNSITPGESTNAKDSASALPSGARAAV
jgi:hypothetical protein